MDKTRQHTYICHTSCQYFPCHRDADPDDFNCLFCYCPLYALGEACGGNFRYTADGIKDCSACLLPHQDSGYARILEGCQRIAALLRDKRRREELP